MKRTMVQAIVLVLGGISTDVAQAQGTDSCVSHDTLVLTTRPVVLESHTYDTSRRGLTSLRATGVDAVTVTYPQ